MKLPLLHREPEEQIEEVDGVLCWDPETGPVGPGPHGPQPDTYRVFEGRDGCLKVAPIQRTDDGRERFRWDDEKFEYVSAEAAYEAAMRGEQATRGPRPPQKNIFVADSIGDVFDEVTKKKLEDILKRYGV